MFQNSVFDLKLVWDFLYLVCWFSSFIRSLRILLLACVLILLYGVFFFFFAIFSVLLWLLTFCLEVLFCFYYLIDCLFVYLRGPLPGGRNGINEVCKCEKRIYASFCHPMLNIVSLLSSGGESLYKVIQSARLLCTTLKSMSVIMKVEVQFYTQ